jgi:hypothetical protein
VQLVIQVLPVRLAAVLFLLQAEKNGISENKMASQKKQHGVSEKKNKMGSQKKNKMESQKKNGVTGKNFF